MQTIFREAMAETLADLSVNPPRTGGGDKKGFSFGIEKPYAYSYTW